MAGENFLNRPPVKLAGDGDGTGWRVSGGPRSFGELKNDPTRPLRGSNPLEEKVRETLLERPEIAERYVGEPPAYVDVDADGKRTADTFDVALQGAALQILGRPRSQRERHERYLAKSQTERVEAETSAKAAEAGRRGAARDAEAAQWRVKLDNMNEEQVGRLLVSESFAEASQQKQDMVHGLLEEMGWEAAEEVDLNIAQLEEREADEAFEFPAPTQAMPWEEPPEVEDADEEDEESYYNEDEA